LIFRPVTCCRRRNLALRWPIDAAAYLLACSLADAVVMILAHLKEGHKGGGSVSEIRAFAVNVEQGAAVVPNVCAVVVDVFFVGSDFEDMVVLEQPACQ
jgi:urease gamma subunit